MFSLMTTFGKKVGYAMVPPLQVGYMLSLSIYRLTSASGGGPWSRQSSVPTSTTSSTAPPPQPKPAPNDLRLPTVTPGQRYDRDLFDLMRDPKMSWHVFQGVLTVKNVQLHRHTVSSIADQWSVLARHPCWHNTA